jgi:pre-peptidase/dockerin type I repeat protein
LARSVHVYSTHRILVAAWLAALGILLVVPLGRAQEVCRGDVDGDGEVTTDDVAALVGALGAGLDLDVLTRMRADANGDGVISAADLAAVLDQIGRPCRASAPTPSPTPTPSLTPSVIDTPTGTPKTATATLSPSVTGTSAATSTPTKTLTAVIGLPTDTPIIATATPPIPSPRPTDTPAASAACFIQSAMLGSTDGELTSDDCMQSFDREMRHADVYSIARRPGVAIKVEVEATGTTASIAPYVAVLDAGGQFDSVQGAPPIEFVVTTSRPYQIAVTSVPGTEQQLGSYRLTLTEIPCPTPVALMLPSYRFHYLTGDECPDPGVPSVEGAANPADVYTFSVSAVPQTVSITMRQIYQTSSIDPAFSVLGPDGFEIVTQDQDDNAAPDGFGADAQAGFLALRAGTYTIVAVGGGGTGLYSLHVTASACTAQVLTDIPPDHPLNCGGSSTGCSGTLYGDPALTPCAAPVPMPGSDSGVPELNSAADLYTFTGNAGEVISIEMDSSDDAHLYLLGPASAGNPVVAEDDDSVNGSDAQLAATLPQTGTYTIVAANNNALAPPSPPSDPGDSVGYTLFVQKCPPRAALDVSAGVITETFTAADCTGFGGLPFRTYSFSGSAGQFVTATMRSDDVDAFLRLYAPDGGRMENDDDPFDPAGSDARANRILPLTGTYFVEASAAAGSAGNLAGAAFRLQVETCPTAGLSPGTTTGVWQDSDCQLAAGERIDVYTLDPLSPNVASILPPQNGCILALLADGSQVPADGCHADLTEFPVLGGGVSGVIIAATDPATSGPYNVQLSTCPLHVLSYGGAYAGFIASLSCEGNADWFLVQAPAPLVQFNQSVDGTVSAGFPHTGVLVDESGSFPFASAFADDPDNMFPVDTQLGVMVKVAAATPGAGGGYSISIDPASLRQ